MSSLYSQPMTRSALSSATNESSLIQTPYDDEGPYRHASGLKSRSNAMDGVHIRSPSSATSSRLGVRAYRDIEDAGSYIPRAPSDASSPGTGQLSRRWTTKALIGRFEALDDAASTSLGYGLAKADKRGSAAVRRSPGEKKDKGRLPIRESFRNLLSVFKRSKPTLKDLSPNPPSARLRESSPKRAAADEAQAQQQQQKPHSSLTLQIPPAGRTDEKVVCISPVEGHTGKAGPLLYLSRIADSDLPPVWMNCTAQLHSTHILVMWDTPQGNPSPRLVPFTACSDVRSLAPADLEPEERASLPADEAWKVFELLFEGRAREKFAAHSLTERAMWVSAVWDAVLQAQENRVLSPARSDSTRTPVPARSDVAPPTPAASGSAMVAIGENKTPADTSSSSRIAKLDRELPPVPTERSAPPVLPRLDLNNLSISSTALSPLPTPPTPMSVRRSFLSPVSPQSPTRTQSPSIRNLDQRSVVKQRLAQLQSASPSPRPSTPLSPIPRRVVKSEILTNQLRRQDSTASSVATSILNSYLFPHEATSPVSARPNSAAASRMGSPPPRRRRDQGNESEDKHPSARLFSPASQYSVDDNNQKGFRSRELHEARPSLFANLPPAPSAGNGASEGRSAGTPASKPSLQDIKRGIEVLQGRSEADGTNIASIRANVDEVLDELRRLPKDKSRDAAAVMAKLELVQVELKEQLSALHATLEKMRGSQSEGEKTQSGQDLSRLSELQEKLDKLLHLQQAQRDPASATGEATNPDANNDTGAPRLGDVVVLLNDAREQRSAQMEQQTDSIRYLNELNTWLEAFVKHGTSQIEGVAAGVQQLCRELGPIPELQDGGSEGDQADSTQGSLLSDVRRLLVQTQGREQDTANLCASVNGLLAAVQEDLKKNAEARNLLTTESVVGMIDRQRQDQERMLKVLATEISNDIRGERLRFVEAMKEATAINVQIHVEEFKKELTREVLVMTQEVTRLQRERQGLEQQIADLFAFYAKQKQAGKVTKTADAALSGLKENQPTVTAQVPFIGHTLKVSGSKRRPLPNPTPPVTPGAYY